VLESAGAAAFELTFDDLGEIASAAPETPLQGAHYRANPERMIGR